MKRMAFKGAVLFFVHAVNGVPGQAIIAIVAGYGGEN